MRWKICILMGLLMLLLTGCGPQCRDVQACVTGCVAGMQYNGTEYQEMELTEQDVAKIQECQRFCKVYFESDMSRRDVMPDD